MKKTISLLIIISLIAFVIVFFINKSHEKETVLTTAKQIYGESCINCHAISAETVDDTKQKAPVLLDKTLPTRYKTKERLEQFIIENMPANQPGSLTDEQAKALAIYLWDINETN